MEPYRLIQVLPSFNESIQSLVYGPLENEILCTSSHELKRWKLSKDFLEKAIEVWSYRVQTEGVKITTAITALDNLGNRNNPQLFLELGFIIGFSNGDINVHKLDNSLLVCVNVGPSPLCSLTWSSAGHLISSSSDGKVSVCQTPSFEFLHSFDTLQNHPQIIGLPNNSIASASQENGQTSLRFWDLSATAQESACDSNLEMVESIRFLLQSLSSVYISPSPFRIPTVVLKKWIDLVDTAKAGPETLSLSSDAPFGLCLPQLAEPSSSSSRPPSIGLSIGGGNSFADSHRRDLERWNAKHRALDDLDSYANALLLFHASPAASIHPSSKEGNDHTNAKVDEVVMFQKSFEAQIMENLIYPQSSSDLVRPFINDCTVLGTESGKEYVSVGKEAVVWKGKNVIQSILHPKDRPVLRVLAMPSAADGDFITASADGILRFFSKQERYKDHPSVAHLVQQYLLEIYQK